jgi:hypothetical protein
MPGRSITVSPNDTLAGAEAIRTVGVSTTLDVPADESLAGAGAPLPVGAGAPLSVRAVVTVGAGFEPPAQPASAAAATSTKMK